ncbi:MAG: DUF3137 domain-containing protein [Muribaculaceae bacterium]|nr:DUF3137 domain-containing protein [Muribaculaceae bacterium]
MQTQNKKEFIDKISNKLAKYEDERVRKILLLILQEAITIVVMCYSYKFGTIAYAQDIGLAGFVLYSISFLGFGFLFYAPFDFNKRFKTFLKNKCRSNIVKAFELDTMKGRFFDLDVLQKSNLFSTFNTYERDDIIEGCYKNVDFKIAETELISKGNKGALCVFKGIVISFDSNKKIKAETLITTKGDYMIRNYPPINKPLLLFLLSCACLQFFVFLVCFSINSKDSLPLIFATLPWVIVLTAVIIQRRKMQDVKLEDVKFDKRFNVYTTNQVEARYLLTTSFMDRLKSLGTAFGTKGIKCSFFKNKIMIAIPVNKDLFELGGLYKSLKSTKNVERFYDELNSIHMMIEHLKLNEKTGL